MIFFLCVLCFYMCFFDCKCKDLKRLGGNRKTEQKQNRQTRRNTQNRNTGFPAHEPPRKMNISKGLAGIFFVFFLFLIMFSFEFLCFLFLYVFFDCKCKSSKRLGENKNNKKHNRNKTEKLEGTQKQTEIQHFQPTNLRE